MLGVLPFIGEPSNFDFAGMIDFEGRTLGNTKDSKVNFKES